jgi:uncharacterized protein
LTTATHPKLAQLALAALICLAVVPGCSSDDDSEPQPGPAPLPEIDQSLFDYDRGRPLDVRSQPVQNRQGFKLERLSYAGETGRRVPALFVPSVDGEPGPCILYQLGVGVPPEAALVVAGALANQGIGTFSIDTRAGRGGGRVLRDPDLFAGFLRETTVDLRRALDVMEGLGSCDPERIGYIGVSLGGILGSLLAGADDRVKAPIFIVAGGDWRRILSGDNPVLPGIERQPERFRNALSALEPFDPARWLPHVSPRPVLVINGTLDNVIPVSAARVLRRAAGDPHRLVYYEGGHDDYAASERVRRLIQDWIAENLLR